METKKIQEAAGLIRWISDKETTDALIADFSIATKKPGSGEIHNSFKVLKKNHQPIYSQKVSSETDTK